MKLFNFKPGGRTITTNDGDKKIAVIRKNPRIIAARVIGYGRVVLWNTKEEVETHAEDSEETLIQKVIDVMNA